MATNMFIVMSRHLTLFAAAVRRDWHITTSLLFIAVAVHGDYLSRSLFEALLQHWHEEAHISCTGGLPVDYWMDPAVDWLRQRGTRHYLLHHASQSKWKIQIILKG